MGKWIGRLFYAILIVFMTFFIIQSAFDARSNAYLLENMTDEWDNEAQFFKGVNTLLDLDYMTSDPIIPAYVDDTGAHRLTFQLYGIGYTDQEGNHLEGLMIFINDIVIYEQDERTGFMEQVENPYIRLTIYTDELIENSTDTVVYTGFEGQNFAAGFVFEQASEEVAFDLEKSDGTIATITRIDVDYSNGASNGGSLVYATESVMIIANETVEDPVYDDSLKISDFSYDPEAYRLADDITAFPVTDAEASSLNLFIDRDDITAYNWEMIRIYLLYAGFVIIITYLLFFHKKTMAMIRAKRSAKKTNMNDEKEIIDAEPVESIFKDVEPEEDGK